MRIIGTFTYKGIMIVFNVAIMIFDLMEQLVALGELTRFSQLRLDVCQALMQDIRITKVAQKDMIRRANKV